jgi:glycosyltransferase involved in cell wall biosynthesis
MIIARLTTVRMSLSLLVNGQADFFRSKGHTYFLASGPCAHNITDKYYTELPLVRRPQIYKDFKALIATYLWLRRIKPDILHTHTPKAGLIGMIAGFFARVPVRIHTVAGIPWMETSGALRKFYKLFESLTYIFATKIYPNSNGLHNFLTVELPFASRKYKVIGSGSTNGIDIDHFSIDAIIESKEKLRDSYNLPQDAYVWVFIGRIVKDKGINELVDAFLKIGANHFLLLVGPFENNQDPISPETSLLIESSSNIRTYGFQKDVRPFIKLADTLVFPSYREGFPNVPMQAAAMGLPQIVTDIIGCNEIVISGVTGLVIPPKNSQALFEAMLRLSNDFELRKNMSINSRSFITKRFSRIDIWNSIEEEYNDLFFKAKK